MEEKLISLSENQTKLLTERIKDLNKSPASLKELMQLAFGKEIDGRDPRSKMVKTLCAQYGHNPKSSFELRPRVFLTHEQEITIQAQAMKMSPLEISKMIFNNELLTNLSPQTKLVANYIKSLNLTNPFDNPDDYILKKYDVPNTTLEIIERVNRFTRAGLKPEELTAKQQKDAQAMMNHLHVMRFLHQMSTFQNKIDRDLFESTFIRHVWPKAADVTNEECDLFIIIASESVIEANIKRRIENLQSMLDDSVKESKNDEKKRISMSLVEAIGKLTSEYDACIKRQKNLLSDVNVKRSERIKTKVSENQSLVTLMEFWKNHQNRQQMIKLAKARKEDLKSEIERIKNMDDLEIQIFGISPEELLGE